MIPRVRGTKGPLTPSRSFLKLEARFIAGGPTSALATAVTTAAAQFFVVVAAQGDKQEGLKRLLRLAGYFANALRERTIDVAVVPTGQSSENQGLDSELLFEDQLLVGAGLQNRWVRHRRIELAELMGECWIWHFGNTPAGTLVENGFRSHGLALPRTRRRVGFPSPSQQPARDRPLSQRSTGINAAVWAEASRLQETTDPTAGVDAV